MKNYRCAWPCTLGGVAYRVGEAIRDGAIAEGNAKKLIVMGYIEEAAQERPTAPSMASWPQAAVTLNVSEERATEPSSASRQRKSAGKKVR